MKTILFILMLLPSLAYSRTIRVAVIDTGLQTSVTDKVKLCETGHKDLTGEGLHDKNGHGTNVTGLIQKHAGDADYCFIIIKAYKRESGTWTTYFPEALNQAVRANADIVNLSGGGYGFDDIERDATIRLLDKGIVFIVSAGNEGRDLGLGCWTFPACYDKRARVIGNSTSLSNYGTPVDAMIDGTRKEAFGITLTGSSQSTAIFTGQAVGSL